MVFFIIALIGRLAVGIGEALDAVQFGMWAHEQRTSKKKKKKRRRRIIGGEFNGYYDTVCSKTMEVVRELPYLKEVFTNVGGDNIPVVKKTVDALEELLSEMAKENPDMSQAEFYVKLGKFLGYEMFEGVWLTAYGNDKDQTSGCGEVVNKVNELTKNGIGAGMQWGNNFLPWVRRVELENGEEVFVSGDSTDVVEEEGTKSTFRRLLGASSSAVLGAGVYLAYVCKSFNEDNTLNLDDLVE